MIPILLRIIRRKWFIALFFLLSGIGLGWWISSLTGTSASVGEVSLKAPSFEKEKIAPITDSTSLDKLYGAMTRIDTASYMKSARWAFYAQVVDSPKAFIEYNADMSMAPASIMKTVTTGIALDKLGADFRFKTYLQYDGQIDAAKRVLNGNIYIKGGGDPTLASQQYDKDGKNFLEQCLNAVKKLGVDSINGAIIGDAESFDFEIAPGSWEWDDLQNDYGAYVSALNYRENTYTLTLSSKGNGFSTKTDPEIPDLNLQSMAVPHSAQKSAVFVLGGPYDTERVAIGTVTGGKYEFESPMPDPAHTCAFQVYKKLKSSGITVRDSSTTLRKLKILKKAPKNERSTFYTFYSQSLKEIVTRTNLVSHNLYAECLQRAISYNVNGYGSRVESSQMVREYLSEKGINPMGFFMVDGCGLARTNMLTARQLTQLLLSYYRNPSISKDFLESLAVAGQSGTLRNYCKGTTAEGNVMAKSGYMGFVRSFAGFAKDKKGRLIAFTMISNNHMCDPSVVRQHFEELMTRLAELDR